MASPVMVGGIGESKAADDVVRDICEKIREEVEAKSGVKYSEFTALVYKTQLVNGVNYFVKVRVAPEQHIHVRVHKTFDGKTVTLSNYQSDKLFDEEIVYFQ